MACRRSVDLRGARRLAARCWRLRGHGVRHARARRSAQPRRGQARTTTVAVAEYTKSLRAKPNNRDARRRSSAPSCAPRRITSPRAAAWPRPASSKKRSSNISSRPSSIRPTATSTTSCGRARSQLRAKIAVTDEGKTRARVADPAQPRCPVARRRPAATTHAAGLADFPRRQRARLFSAIGKFANISIVFDPTFRDQPVSIDLREQ